MYVYRYMDTDIKVSI